MANRFRQSIELQRILDSPIDDDDFKLHCIRTSLDDINEGWNAQQRRLFHADSALHIDDQLTFDSKINPSRIFGEIILKGTVP